MTPAKEDFLEEHVRAADILLGGLGFGEDAQVIEVTLEGERFFGRGKWADGEEFSFESEDEVTDLEKWAIEILGRKDQKKVVNE
ncbi:MAG: hypothetical protein KDD70_03240 [Bdellovibrionales bacterium]|nr:hypothetical protein [Bdellovibrionales bacterium]